MWNRPVSQIFSSILALIVLAGCACTDNRRPEADNKDKNERNIAAVSLPTREAIVKKAIVEVKPVAGHQVRGKVTFTKVPDGIKIVADIHGLKPGKHGFHVHEHGDCGGKEAAAAGGHFNPTNSRHGGPDSPERHVGDFGNLEADRNGHAHYERVDKLITFEGKNSILGRSIVIHADPDDYTTQPTGNSGARIGCGIIDPVLEKGA